jgi:Immunity protein 49
MTIQIPFHEYDIELSREDVDYYADLIKKDLRDLGRGDKPNLTLRDVADDAISYAGLLSQYRPCCTDLGNAIWQAAYAWDHAFILAKYPRNDRRLEVFVPPADPFMMATTGSTGYINARSWIKAFYLACICREPQINDSLIEIPTELLREASKHGLHTGEYSYIQVEMLKAFWRNDPNFPNIAVEALAASIDEEKLGENFIDYALNIASCEISLLINIHTEQEKFNDMLAEAVERHKHYFFRKEESSNAARFFLALGPLAMASIAYMRDIPIEVESDYIPRCIIEDKYVRQPEDAPIPV